MEPLVGTVAGVFDLKGRPRLEGAKVAHLTRSDGSWWAVSDLGLLHDGETAAPPPPGATLDCVALGPDEVWVGGDSARLFRLEDGELAQDEAFAAAPGRGTWHTPWGGPPDVRSLSVGPDGVLYVNVHVGGILRREGGGFAPTVDIHSDVHQVVCHPHRPGVVAAATGRGLAVALDGAHFAFRTEGLSHSYCRAVAVEGDTVLVSASRGPRGGGARLYRGSLEGGELASCDGLPVFDRNLDTHCVQARPDAYLVGNGPTVWVSTDGGSSWETATDGLPTVTSIA